MTKLYSFLFIFLLLISCNDKDAKVTEESTQPLTYLALGDSYTIGESVAPALRWPVQLVDSLRERGVEINVPKIIAKTGWTTQDLLLAMEQQLKEEKYDLVSILIGVNNQYQGKSIEDYKNDLDEIFTEAIAHSKTGKDGVFAVSIPDYGATPFGAERSEEIAAEIEEFNGVFKAKAEVYGVPFYNITPISKRAAQEADLVANDDLHPSGRMYSLWVEEFIDEVIERIASEI